MSGVNREAFLRSDASALELWGDGPLLEPVCVTSDPRRLDARALVLVSRGFHPFVRVVEGHFELYVPPEELEGARDELAAADAEERELTQNRVVEDAYPPQTSTRRAALASLCMSLLLLGFFAITGPRAGQSVWFANGSADAQRVLEGEFWRTITALTLHADSAHVLSNVGLGAFVVGAVMRAEGVGMGSALVLASGALGNWVNAWAHQSFHRSVGFSTAVFGAIGLLGGLAYMRRRAGGHRQLPAWTALGGTLALLGMLGTGGERTDLFAHLFGALVGVVLGVCAARLRVKSALGQWCAGLGTMAVVVGAWLRALG